MIQPSGKGKAAHHNSYLRLNRPELSSPSPRSQPCSLRSIYVSVPISSSCSLRSICDYAPRTSPYSQSRVYDYSLLFSACSRQRISDREPASFPSIPPAFQESSYRMILALPLVFCGWLSLDVARVSAATGKQRVRKKNVQRRNMPKRCHDPSIGQRDFASLPPCSRCGFQVSFQQ